MDKPVPRELEETIALLKKDITECKKVRIFMSKEKSANLFCDYEFYKTWWRIDGKGRLIRSICHGKCQTSKLAFDIGRVRFGIVGVTIPEVKGKTYVYTLATSLGKMTGAIRSGG